MGATYALLFGQCSVRYVAYACISNVWMLHMYFFYAEIRESAVLFTYKKHQAELVLLSEVVWVVLDFQSIE